MSRVDRNERYRGSPGCAALLALLAFPAVGWADDDGLSFSGILIGTYQSAGDSLEGEPIAEEASGALDLGATLPLAGGALEVEVKGATTPQTDRVSSLLPEVNASVGETLDNHEEGRVVVWQAFFRRDLGPGSLSAGLIDPSGWLDGNPVANDEFTQFLGASFVNNLSVDLPSATLGAAYSAQLRGGWAMTALVSNATGIEPDYEDAFRPGEHGNGLFAALELQWAGPGLGANLGVWTNTRSHDSDGDGIDDERLADDAAKGVYANLTGGLAAGHWNLRLGLADAQVQPAAGFVGLAYAYPIGDALLGLGVAHTFASHNLPDPHADLTQAEVYLDVPLGGGLSVTPDLQYVRHSELDPERDGTWVGGLRVGLSF